MELNRLYKNRFDKAELQKKYDIWKILCDKFFQKFVPLNAVVVDIGAGYCEFINNIKCAEKYAVDLNEDAFIFASDEVKVCKCSSVNLSVFNDNSVDIVFMSNFLEHLTLKEDIVKTLSECFRILKENGNILILQPNVKYLYREYWDYFDHNLPLSDKSLAEILHYTGFQVKYCIPKFLPYTMKSRIPKKSIFIQLYLRFPLIWKIMGKQTFLIGEKVKNS